METSYWIERAASVLPSATPEQIERAAFVLAMQYTAAEAVYDVNGSDMPRWEYAPGKVTPSTACLPFDEIKPRTIGAPYLTGVQFPDPRARDTVAGGGVADVTPAPDAWAAIKHHMRADGTVGRYGNARVQGDGRTTIAGDLPNGATPSLLWRMCDDLPRNSVGAIGWQVSKLADLFYGPAGLPALLGNDVSGAPDPDLARAIAVPGFVQGIVGQSTADAPDRRMQWPMRTRLPRVTVRKSEQVTRAGRLAAPHSDPTRIWFGHTCYRRGKLTHATRGGKRAARTLDLVGATVETPSALATLAECLNRGERVAVTYAGRTLTITRGKGTAGTYSLTVPGAGKANGLRTPQNVAKHASALVTA